MKMCVVSIALAGLTLASAPLALAADPATTTGAACPFTANELGKALGFAVDAGKGSETAFPGGKILSCTYPARQKLGVVVSQTLSAKREDAIQIAKGVQGTPIADDADNAVWVKPFGSAFRLPLSYVRGTTHTEVSVTSIDAKNAAEANPMMKKILALRRVP